MNTFLALSQHATQNTPFYSLQRSDALQRITFVYLIFHANVHHTRKMSIYSSPTYATIFATHLYPFFALSPQNPIRYFEYMVRWAYEHSSSHSTFFLLDSAEGLAFFVG